MDSKKLITKFNLPSYIAGKSFAEASKAIETKFKDRADKTSTDTKKALLDRLQQAQEYVKSRGISPAINNEFAPGGYVDNSLEAKNKNTTALNIAGGIGAAMPTMTTTPIGQTAEQTSVDNNADKAKDGVAAAIPIAGIFRGIEKMGIGIAQTTGGDEHAAISKGLFDPIGSKAKLYKDPDATNTEKILGTLGGGASGQILNKYNKEREAKSLQTGIMAQNAQQFSDFAKGGKMTNKYHNGGGPHDHKVPYATGQAPIESPFNYGKAKQDVVNRPKTYIPENDLLFPTGPRQNTGSEADQLTASRDETSSPGNVTVKDNKNKFDYNDTASKASSALRYAPAAMSAYQLSKLERPDAVALDKLGNKYKKTYMDEARIRNLVDQDLNNSIGAISNVSGGSAAAARAGILGSGLNRAKALGDSYGKIAQYNAVQNDRAQEFDYRKDAANIIQSNTQQSINDQNSAAFESEKRRLQSEVAGNVGAIGKEQLYKRYPKMIGLGYNWNGKYFVNPETGDTKTKEEASTLETNSSSKGGYLTKDVLSHINKTYVNRKKK